eukprot:c9586_g1_i1.p1 GENE.c9586_g1_i1~~c9586_g1_i1.p1  ORF type:complete len:741 (-),score=144.70 c9586_g1_i1:38-2260(-)
MCFSCLLCSSRVLAFTRVQASCFTLFTTQPAFHTIDTFKQPPVLTTNTTFLHLTKNREDKELLFLESNLECMWGVLVLALCVLLPLFLFFRSSKEKRDPRDASGQVEGNKAQTEPSSASSAATTSAHTEPVANETVAPTPKETDDSITVFYGTVTGSSEKFAQELVALLKQASLPAVSVNLASYEPEEIILERKAVFILPTWENGQPPPNASWFCDWLRGARLDERFGSGYLSSLRYSVFGVGSSAYTENYNRVARQVDSWLMGLGAEKFVARGEGDQERDAKQQFDTWASKVVRSLAQLSSETKPVPQVDEEQLDEDVSESEGSEGGDAEEGGDMEDMAGSSHKKAATTASREMVSSVIRESLTKQGYRIVGSHSGVKICRWTKAMLRGRGGCYKHTMYGIQSHQCMEATPSLACANKCVFCWRHHSNPVGKEWKWTMDPPEVLVDGFMHNHYDMIKQLRGVPGVRKERFDEAFRIRHCALSLVGEPIMYPKINEFLTLLHNRRISSYLVTNAQFPEAIRNLNPVTQLYVSIDAATPETLKAIDRPLFSDYWERYIASLEAIRLKTATRTVYRLTLVSSWNTSEIAEYAQLVMIGRPDFIEVKGVTFCGSSKGSTLTMKNVPYHEDVVAFCKQLSVAVNQLLHQESDFDGFEYDLACEHSHSCCVCIASTRFRKDNVWYTWIDYDRFQDLWKKWSEDGTPFSKEQYTLQTPSWALFGAKEQGFDPDDVRVKTKGSAKKE